MTDSQCPIKRPRKTRGARGGHCFKSLALAMADSVSQRQIGAVLKKMLRAHGADVLLQDPCTQMRPAVILQECCSETTDFQAKHRL